MKKRKGIFLCCAVLAFVLVMYACGSSGSSGSSDVNEDEYSEETEVAEVEFEEITVVDNEECTIKITGLDPDNFWGYTLDVYFENKSADKTYMFSVKDASINGVESDPFFATTVTAETKANKDINFSTSTLEDNGITEFTDIEITFRVYDSDDWLADDVANETVHVYPYGEENAVRYERETLASDTVLADNEYVKVTVTGYEEDSIWGYSVNLFLENKTDSEVMFSVDDASVNGYMADPFYAKSVPARKSAFSSMSWSNSTFEENGIDEVESIKFTLKAYDSDDYSKDKYFNDTVEWNP